MVLFGSVPKMVLDLATQNAAVLIFSYRTYTGICSVLAGQPSKPVSRTNQCLGFLRRLSRGWWSLCCVHLAQFWLDDAPTNLVQLTSHQMGTTFDQCAWCVFGSYHQLFNGLSNLTATVLQSFLNRERAAAIIHTLLRVTKSTLQIPPPVTHSIITIICTTVAPGTPS